MKGILRIFNGVCPYVIFFGIFVIFSLLLQCFVPFILRMAELGYNGNIAFLSQIINVNFNLPMEMISNFWAAISATYVGLDRAAFTVEALKNDKNTDAFCEEKLVQLNQIIWLSFIIYIIAVLLNTFFDAELALMPLLISFASSLLAYVAGNKAVRAFENLSKDKNPSVLDGLDEQQQLTLTRISGLIKSKKEITIKLDSDSKIVGMK